VNLVTQTHSDDEPLGGTGVSVAALFGVRVSPRVAIEFEPALGGSYSWEYTYRPAASLVADVVASRKDTYFPVQVRVRTGGLEPVVGVAVVHSHIARHATIGNTTYFDDDRSENDFVLVAGLDAAFKLNSRLYVVPTFRALVGSRGSTDDPFGEQTSTGLFTFRYGVGARVEF
jgi:hypothetical protein